MHWLESFGIIIFCIVLTPFALVMVYEFFLWLKEDLPKVRLSKIIKAIQTTLKDPRELAQAIIIVVMFIGFACMLYGGVLRGQNLPKSSVNDGVTLKATKKGLSVSAITSKAIIRWVDVREQVGHADEKGW